LHGITGWCVALANWGANSKHPPGSCALARSGGSGVFTYDAAEDILVDVRSALRDNYDFGSARYAVLSDVVESSIDLLNTLLRECPPPRQKVQGKPRKPRANRRADITAKIESHFSTGDGQRKVFACHTETQVAELLGINRRQLSANPAWRVPSVFVDGKKVSRQHLWRQQHLEKARVRRGQDGTYGNRTLANRGRAATREHFDSVDEHLDESTPESE
jgi:hypothetical protein